MLLIWTLQSTLILTEICIVGIDILVNGSICGGRGGGVGKGEHNRGQV